MRAILICLTLALSACNTVPPAWQGVPFKRVEVGGTPFDVRRNGKVVHAFRRSTEWAPNFRSMAPKAKRAIEQATGCRIVPGTMTGDQVFIQALVQGACLSAGQFVTR